MFPFALVTLGVPAADEIKVLPGWNLPLPSKMFSGYVNTSEMMGIPCQVHYWFIESEGDATTDPTLLWTNGGPGASSMFGITVELGPLLLNEYSLSTDEYFKTGVPTLYRNDFSWSKLGSILMFDWAPPVGFSYCNNDPTGDGFSCGKWDDERMAKLSYAALSGWYDLFPERRNNKLFLTGESYAGIYVPKLAQQILLHNDPKVRPQLAGFAVGDGCLGTESGVCGSGNGPWWDVLFLYGHHQISTELFDELVSECGMDYLKYAKPEVDPIKCREALNRIDYEKGGYFGYALYDDCIYQEGLRRRRVPQMDCIRRCAHRDARATQLLLLRFGRRRPVLRLGEEPDAVLSPGGGHDRPQSPHLQWRLRPVDQLLRGCKLDVAHGLHPYADVAPMDAR